MIRFPLKHSKDGANWCTNSLGEVLWPKQQHKNYILTNNPRPLTG